MKPIYVTVIKNRKQLGRSCRISKDLLSEILEDSKHYKIRQCEVLGDVRLYDILHITDNDDRSVLIICEEL